MVPPTLESVFFGQDSLYFQSSLTLATFAITSSSNKSEIQFGHDNGSINNLPTMECLALPPDLYWDIKFEPISASSQLFFIYDALNGSWISGENFANDITIISKDGIELEHDMDLTEELLGNDEELVVEFYDMHEGNHPPF
uniref:Uncharacterized protein n=1 Tax=Glossina morsitans morsitans TaxID=37546 RepID=A0A1B0FLY6_GLOMM